MSTLSIATIKSQNTLPPAVQNSSGTEIGTFCRAWVNFNGTGTVAIRASFNVSSITDNGTGDYTVNFTTAMSDVNYATIGTGSNNSGSASNLPMTVQMDYRQSTTGARITTGSTAGVADFPFTSVAIFR